MKSALERHTAERHAEAVILRLLRRAPGSRHRDGAVIELPLLTLARQTQLTFHATRTAVNRLVARHLVEQVEDDEGSATYRLAPKHQRR